MSKSLEYHPILGFLPYSKPSRSSGADWLELVLEDL